jgi:hypothetical protein
VAKLCYNVTMIPIDNHISESLDSTGAPKRNIDHSSWTYVDLHDLDNDPRPFNVKGDLVDSYRIWLVEHLGTRGATWEFRTGDRYAQGVYFKEPQAATVFKLTFTL